MMKKCVWVRPGLVAQIEFLKWTDADQLRLSKSVRLRDDKEPRSVVNENLGGIDSYFISTPSEHSPPWLRQHDQKALGVVGHLLMNPDG